MLSIRNTALLKKNISHTDMTDTLIFTVSVFSPVTKTFFFILQT